MRRVSKSSGGAASAWGISLAAVVTFVVAYVGLAGLRPLASPDESRYAEIAREMLATGDWCVPRLLGLRYFEKPVGGYWVFAIALDLFGPSAFAVRLPSILASGVTALLVALLVRRATRSSRLGAAAAAIHLSMPMVFGVGTYAILDPLLSMWLVAALAAAWRIREAPRPGTRLAWWLVFGACCGGAFLTKGFVALAVSVISVGPFMLWQGRWRELLTHGWLAVAAAAAVALPWGLAIHAREPDYWRYFFWEEHVRRFLAHDAQHPAPWWFYVPIVLGLGLPWTSAVAPVLRNSLREAFVERNAFARFGLLALCMPLLFFSASRGKLATYVLPCFAPLAMLTAPVLAGEGHAARRWSKAVAGVAAGLGASWVLGVAAVTLVRPTLLFDAADQWRALVLVGCGLCWTGVALAALREFVPVLPSLAMLPVVMAVAGAVAVPTRLRDSKMPGVFVRQVADRVPPRAAVACDSISAIFSVAFELRRSDIVIVGGAGELEYGVNQHDVVDRIFATPSAFSGWLRRTRLRRPVALFARVPRDASLTRYPPPDWSVRGARMALLYYERRNR